MMVASFAFTPGRRNRASFRGVPFSLHDGFDNVHAGLDRDVADDVLELHVHLGERLLHVLDVMRSVLH